MVKVYVVETPVYFVDGGGTGGRYLSVLTLYPYGGGSDTLLMKKELVCCVKKWRLQWKSGSSGHRVDVEVAMLRNRATDKIRRRVGAKFGSSVPRSRSPFFGPK